MSNLHVVVFLALAYISLLVSGSSLDDRDVAVKNVCEKKSAILSKLSACTTATSFCSSFLGYTGAPPTVTIATTQIESSIIAKSMTVQETTTNALGGTVTSGVSTVTSTRKVTIAISSSLCTGIISVSYGSSDVVNGQAKQHFTSSSPTGPPTYKTTFPPEACGLRRSAIGAVSTGCSCFLDPTVTSTSTKIQKTTTTVLTTITKYTTIAGTLTVPSDTVTTTVTLTRTITTGPPQTACPTPDTSCGNLGLEWSYVPAQPLTASDNLTDTNNIYSPFFEPANTKLTPPTYNGTTGEAGYFWTGDGYGDWDIYGVSVPASYTLVNHRGYFFAPQDGVYSFAYRRIDDKGFVWWGQTAYSGWNASNADETASYGVNSGREAVLTLVGGTYYAYRNYFAQGNGPGELDSYIVAPDGTPVATSEADASAYFVRFSCDGVMAPAYPPFGEET